MADDLLDEFLGWFKSNRKPKRSPQASAPGLFSTLPTNNNLSNWVAGGTLSRELKETRAKWTQMEIAWRASPLAKQSVHEFVADFVRSLYPDLESLPAMPILVALCEATEALWESEPVGEYQANWQIIDTDIEVAFDTRQFMTRRLKWCLDYQRMEGIWRRLLRGAYVDFIRAMPDGAFRDWSGDKPDGFGVPLIELFEDPAQIVGQFLLFPYDDDTLRLDLFLGLRRNLERNLKIASDIPISEDIRDHQHRVIGPHDRKDLTPAELSDLFLARTPFAALMDLTIPFEIPEAIRFEHCHIIGGTGHGKTQLLQNLVHADLIAAKSDNRSVVVVDSQGDLIAKLSRLSLFDPDDPDSLANRLILIDPSDVEHPASLNLFNAHLDRLTTYTPADRERVLNGVVDLYERFFGDLLGAELTQKQGVIFKYLARLMLAIPEATVHTLMQVMEDGRPFRAHMQALDGSARYFFETEFFHPSFAATKRQILKRLWGLLSTPAFERMFAQRDNKLDLFDALQDGKIVFINTAKELLKDEGSQLFGRFFLALIAQAALERSTIDESVRTPTFVYVDEAQEYFDDRVEAILNQARKYRVGLTLAHQTLDQLSTRLRSVIFANTSMKCAGGVSAKDARTLDDEMHTSAEFIESMRRRKGRTEFAVWLKNQTPHAIRLSVPLGFVERQPILEDDALDRLLNDNRRRYCGTRADVLELSRVEWLEEEATTQSRPSAPTPSPPPIPDQLGHQAQPQDLHSPQTQTPARVSREATQSQRAPTTPGKGGAQHRYLQQLIKQLAEERGFRAVVEEAVEGGQVDVGLHRSDLSIACEISITSTPEYETRNLAKCLRAGFERVWAIAPDAKRRKSIQSEAKPRLGPDFERVEFLTTAELVEALDALALQEPDETIVKGYRVTTTRKVVAPAEARDRRASIARILAQSVTRPGD
jgi:hypothetical protein